MLFSVNLKTCGKTVGLLTAFTVMIFSLATAMPPHPLKVEEAIKAGKTISYTPEVIQDELERGINVPSVVTSASRATVTGTFRALAVLIRFPDQPDSTAAEDFDTLIFENRMGTVYNYYNTVSYGQLDLVTLDLPSSIGWVTAPQNYSYYVNGQRGLGAYPNNAQKLCEDIANAIDPLVDFSDYDNDGDGYVDAFILIHTGPGYELTFDVNDIHSHKWGISPQLYDGVYVFEYNIQPEYRNSPGDVTCGVFCHELGHVFGLPDLYDTDYSSRGVGLWSLMATGSWGGPAYDGSRPSEPDAWSRIEFGFANATNVTANTNNANISAVTSGGAIYRLWSSGAIGNEYYLLENRQKTGYDAYLPGDGLLIWHIDETQFSAGNANDNEWYPGNTGSGNYGVALEQADGFYHLEQLINSGDAGDPFPGTSNKTSFTSVTNPGSDSYAGSNTYVSVSDISPSGSVMTADFEVSFALDVAEPNDNLLPDNPLLGQNFPNPFNPSTTININHPKGGNLSLNIYDILGRKVKTLLDGNYQAGQIEVDWDGTDENGRDVSSGVYFYEIVTEEESDSKKMTLLK